VDFLGTNHNLVHESRSSGEGAVI